VFELTATSRGFRREYGSLEEVFAFLEGFTEVEKVSEREAFCINLVVEELFTNMVRHNEGGGESIAVRIERVDDCIHLEMVDCNVGPFDPASAAEVPVDSGVADRSPGGLGLHIVKTMVDEVTYDYDDKNRRMRISVTKRLER
jgi:serine/threonine-protein kinase RsbW